MRHVDDGNEHAYMLMTSSDKLKNVDRAIERNEFILVPNIDAMQKMDLMFEHSDGGMTHEEGFIVYPSGNSTEIQSGNDGDAYMSYYAEKEYSVHIHQLNGPNGEYGLAEPSKFDQEQSNLFGKYEVVLGYGKPNRNSNLSTTATSSIFLQQEDLAVDPNNKRIGFYLDKSHFDLNYDKFKEAIEKIRLHYIGDSDNP